MLHRFRKAPRRVAADCEQEAAKLYAQYQQTSVDLKKMYSTRRAAIEMRYVDALNVLVGEPDKFSQLSKSF